LFGPAEFRRIRSILFGERDGRSHGSKKMSLPAFHPTQNCAAASEDACSAGPSATPLALPLIPGLGRNVRAYGEQGIRDYAPAYGKLGAITDDTQMRSLPPRPVLSAHLAAALQSQEPDFFRAAAVSYSAG